MIKLDLGAWDVSPPGFIPMGHKHGTEIFPLPYPDESVDEIRASHVLEHFPIGQSDAVIADWVRALKKGGRLRIAVPDFEKVAKNYLEGRDGRHEKQILGGQVDEDDFHKALFDHGKLRGLLSRHNLVLVEPWASELDDCAALPISLNLQGYKPHFEGLSVSGAMSTPRLGFMDNFFCCMEAAIACGVKMRKHGGAFWGQSLTRVFERILEEDSPDLIAAIDYDSVFTPKALARMIQIMTLYPEIDALAAIQSSRHIETTLFTVHGTEGENAPRIPREKLAAETMPIATAHFGLTLIRAKKLRELPKPWFVGTPSPDGTWSEGTKTDEDIHFWRQWERAGNTLHLANRVVIGHMELMVRWPDQNLLVFYQPTTDFQREGAPEGVWI